MRYRLPYDNRGEFPRVIASINLPSEARPMIDTKSDHGTLSILLNNLHRPRQHAPISLDALRILQA